MITAKWILRKKKIILFFFLAIAFIFVLFYQMKILDQLRSNNVHSPMHTSISQISLGDMNKGFLLHDTQNNKFVCIKSMEEIPIDHVNDDYCDCLDGSDEPRTNACPTGLFYCNNSNSNVHKSIPSSRVNDGICDCCDGSDEYAKEVSILDSNGYCPNRC